MVTSLVLCDQIMREEIHGKHTLVGVFSVMQATKFPCFCQAVCVFAAFTNGRGVQTIELRCVLADSLETVARIERELDFADPMQIVEASFVLRGCTFPEPGLYCFELRCDDELLGETRCRILPSQPLAEAG